MRDPGTNSVGRCPMARKGCHDNARARCGRQSRHWTRHSDCSIPGGRSMPTRCSRMRGRQPVKRTMPTCGRVLPSLPSVVPIGYAATPKAPTGCFDVRPPHWPHMTARHRTTSTSPGFERGPSNRNREPCPGCARSTRTTHPASDPDSRWRSPSKARAARPWEQGGMEEGVGMVAAGDYRFGADTGRLLIRTYRTGLGSRAGHDLTIEVTVWHGTAAVGADAAASSVALRIDADSFEIREGRGGIKPFTNADRADIRKTIRGLLDTARYPSITFASSGLRGVQRDLSVEGGLTIRTATHPVLVRGSIDESSGKPHLRATAQVVQSEWGIKPYSAFLGALKLRDAVDIDVNATLVPIG